DDTRGAGREAKTSFARHDGPVELRRCVGDVMVEPERAVGMERQVGDDIAVAYFHQSVLHEFRLDEKVRADILEFSDKRAADEPVEIGAPDPSHCRITSSP